MKQGKAICETLKQIRQHVADANGISYAPTPCNHKGDCRGTCPACEAEVRYIERELNARRLLGKAVVVAGIAAGLTSLTSCNRTKDDLKPLSAPEEMTEGKIQTKGMVDLEAVQKIRIDTIDGVLTYSVYSVDTPPEFPGGREAQLKYFTQMLPPASLAHTELPPVVIVTVAAVIDDNGYLKKAWVKESHNKDFDAQALNLVKNMPRWTPATLNGKKVNCQRDISVSFKRPNPNE